MSRAQQMKELGDSIAEKRAEVREPEWMRLLSRTEKGGIRQSAANVATILRHDPEWADVLEYDEREEVTRFAKAPPLPSDLVDARHAGAREVIDVDLVRVQAWCERKHGASFELGSISQGLDVAARERSRDPVREYLDALAWDGTPRIDALASRYLGAEANAYHAAVGSKWMISAVARTYVPGCQADHMPVLEGRQGSGKSSAARALAGQPGWFTDSVTAIGSRDAADSLRGPWIVELAELDAVQRAELATIKAFVSRRTDRFREAYGRRQANHPRRVVFVGSTNESTYLRDPTGARRFWPVRCGRIDLAAITADRDQLWAEARHRFRAGEEWHPDASLSREAGEQQERRYQGDEWEGAVSGYLDGKCETTVREVGVNALDLDLARLDQTAQNRIVRALTRLGWTSTGNPVRRQVEGKPCRVRVYTAPRGESHGD